MLHEKKSWTFLFDAIVSGKKHHDIRKVEDSIKVGDIVILRRFDQATGEYTGETQAVRVTYITDYNTPCAFSSAVLDKEYAVLSIEKVDGPVAQW